MSPRRLGALLVLAVPLVVVAAGAGGVAGTPGGGVDSVPGGATAAGDRAGAAVTTHTPVNRTRDPATVTMRVSLQPDGDARWEVSATLAIDGADDAAAFDELAADFENGAVSLGFEAFRAAADNASAATGREMELRSVERTSSRTDTDGTLTLSFTWSNFARVEGDRLYVGDAFNTTDGTWLPRLTEREALVVVPPSEYGVVSAPQVGIVDGAARWEGPYSFDGREPWVVYSGDAPTVTSPPPTTGPTTTAPPPTTTTGTPPPDGGGPPALSLALLVVVAGVSAALLAAYVRHERGPDSGGGGTTAESGGGGEGGAAAAQTDDATAGAGPESGAAVQPDATGESATDDATADSAATGASAGSAGAGETGEASGEDEAVDETLLSDEERVERLLERNGGRMKQANIVKETGWSNAKVSQLLSSMAEEGRVDKLRIGRENLISFPDEGVTDIDSEDGET